MNFVETIKAAGAACANDSLPVLLGPEDAVQCLILNAASTEPLVETERCLCVMQADRVVAAASKIAKNIGSKRTVIAVRADDRSAEQALAKAIADAHASVELFCTEPIYPADDEMVLTWLVTGRVIPERGTVRDVRCALISIGEALDILAALEGTAVTDRYLTVTGAVKEPLLLKVPLGTRLSVCVKAAQAETDTALIVGGPMKGRFLTSPSAIQAAIVTRTTANLIVLPREHPVFSRAKQPLDTVLRRARSACDQCHMCTEFCPRYGLGHSIRPDRIMRGLQRENELSKGGGYADAFGDAFNCCFCGICDAVCPMGLKPRSVNAYLCGGLKNRGSLVPRAHEPVPHEKTGGIDTARLTALFGLSKYGGFHSFVYRELTADEVFIPFTQRAFRPAQPLKHVGDIVEKGELLAKDGSCAGIHASIGGTVIKISEKGARIKA
ncbi:MAG: 4Fe-4S dicluster domain-containing protein [Oscillospiraceae bacterium]|jgi:Na+-translocating ferredoxin:NAD+ oxidoreductase RnfC subunit